MIWVYFVLGCGVFRGMLFYLTCSLSAVLEFVGLRSWCRVVVLLGCVGSGVYHVMGTCAALLCLWRGVFARCCVSCSGIMMCAASRCCGVCGVVGLCRVFGMSTRALCCIVVCCAVSALWFAFMNDVIRWLGWSCWAA